ncbi:MAG: methionyl-tRNA formyltransferase, partial [Deltaproteobacteria bacterium]
VATIKPWHIQVYHEVVKNYPGEWHLISEPKELSVAKIETLRPKYIFFPHWSHIVPDEILNLSDCICFHETDLPYGRGGSPVQNLIANGHRKTAITALRMIPQLDAGPVYMKRSLSLEGLAEEIFIRSAHIVADMIKVIITENPEPEDQVGEPTFFRRRTSEQSRVPAGISDLMELFDHIRMLDADGYPKAFFDIGPFRYEISRPALRTDAIYADIRITKKKE